MSPVHDDIAKLEKMLNDGEGDDVLCGKCIEIVEWMIREEIEMHNASGLNREVVFEEHCQDFIDVLDLITRRRHNGVLDEFEQHCIKQRYFP